MFGGKKENQFAKGGHTLFDRAVAVEGNVQFGGTLDIEGSVTGNIFAAEDVDALIRIREHGLVEGEVRAPKIIINGVVNGDVYATKHLELAAKAVVNGNVHYDVIEMVKGAQVNGSLVHIEEVQPEKVKASPGVSVSSVEKKVASAKAVS